MAVDPRSLIKPTVTKTRVHADNQKILAAKVSEISHVERERSIAIVIAPDEIPVQKHQRAAKGSVEFDIDAPAGIFLGQIEGAPIPANASLRIAPPQWFVAMTLLLFIANERQLDRPVMRQVERAPLRIIELCRGKLEFTTLGEVSLTLAKAKIVQRVGAIPLKKFPAKVEQQTLTRSYRAGCFRRGYILVGRQQRFGAPHGSRNET